MLKMNYKNTIKIQTWVNNNQNNKKLLVKVE